MTTPTTPPVLPVADLQALRRACAQILEGCETVRAQMRPALPAEVEEAMATALRHDGTLCVECSADALSLIRITLTCVEASGKRNALASAHVPD